MTITLAQLMTWLIALGLVAFSVWVARESWRGRLSRRLTAALCSLGTIAAVRGTLDALEWLSHLAK